MGEKLEVYDLDGDLVGVEDRKEFYKSIQKEFKEKGTVSKKVKSIRVLILNSSGRIFLQKRSNIKEENAGLYDKTIGGHVSAGNHLK